MGKVILILFDNNRKRKIMNPVSAKASVAETIIGSPVKQLNIEEKVYKPADSIEISNTSKAFAKVENFLNLGKRDRLDTGDLNEEEKKEFLKMLSKLLQEGIVGYEILEVNGKPEKHYIVNQIGDERLKGAKLYKKYFRDGTY
jgi:hypothetical protein